MIRLAQTGSSVSSNWFGERIWKKIIQKKEDQNKGEIFAPPPIEYPASDPKPSVVKKQDSAAEKSNVATTKAGDTSITPQNTKSPKIDLQSEIDAEFSKPTDDVAGEVRFWFRGLECLRRGSKIWIHSVRDQPGLFESKVLESAEFLAKFAASDVDLIYLPWEKLLPTGEKSETKPQDAKEV